MLQRGKPRANVPYTRRKISAAEIIARHYTRCNQWAVSGSSKFPFPGIEPSLARMSLVESYGRFAGFQNHSADALPRPGRMDEKRSNLCGIAKGVEKLIFPARPAIAAIECFAFAPAAASDDHGFNFHNLLLCALVAVGVGLRHDIGPVDNQLAIHPKNGLEGTFDLLRGVILRLQAAHRCIDERLQNRNIRRNSKPKMNVRLQGCFSG